MLHYLGRLLLALEQLLQQHPSVCLNPWQQQRLHTITALQEQQQQMHLKAEQVQGRIISLHKPYVRPIIRGKQVKPVEFGCKVHMLQVGGLNFIEHLSYENFNESTRLTSTIKLQNRLCGRLHQLGADRIYATNANRKYCTEHQIATSFVPKGKEGSKADQKALMRAVLSKVRSTHLEGSFGNEKNHYGLQHIKAGTEAAEKVWIFFSVLTANAVQIAKRIGTEAKGTMAA